MASGQGGEVGGSARYPSGRACSALAWVSANRRRTINLKKLYAELHTTSDATGATSLLNPLATTTFTCHANPAVRCSCCSLLRAPYGRGATRVRWRCACAGLSTRSSSSGGEVEVPVRSWRRARGAPRHCKGGDRPVLVLLWTVYITEDVHTYTVRIPP